MTTPSSAAPGQAIHLSLVQVRALSLEALLGAGVAPGNAATVADSVAAAEADGIHSHGLARLPTYCEHARVGKIDGAALPLLHQLRPGLVQVDACDGFAHPAIDLGLPALLASAAAQGIAALAVQRSYNCGVVGFHVERIAAAGFVGLGFVHAPASMAPHGGTRPVFGTNPVAIAVPRAGCAPMVLDQSSSVVAKSEIVVHQQRGEAIPLGWALDSQGLPTSDPSAALNGGSMLPAGGVKGAGIALLVELLAAWATGANLSIDAPSFADNLGGSPRTGQFFIALDIGPMAGPDAPNRLERLFASVLSQDGARLPGERRLAARIRTAREGIFLPAALHARILTYVNSHLTQEH